MQLAAVHHELVKFTVTEDLRIVCFNFEVVKFGEKDDRTKASENNNEKHLP